MVKKQDAEPVNDVFLEQFAPEPLHPDLAARRRTSDAGWEVISHPLVVSVMHADMLNRQVNRRYEKQKAAVQAARAGRNWPRYVFLHERAFRFDALTEIMDDAGWWDAADAEYWKLVGDVWQDSENIHQHYDNWHDVWSAASAARTAAMGERDRAMFDGLSDPIKVWRGAGHAGVKSGLSWTLSRDKAVWFARRHVHPGHAGSFIASGTVQKRHVLAYFGDRNESEVVVLPEHVRGARMRRLPPAG